MGIPEGQQEPWYALKTSDIRNRGGFGLLRVYDGSVSKILQGVFPEFTWDLSRFHRKPRNFYASSDTQREYLESIGLKLGIQKGEFGKWYKVTNDAVIRGGGSTLLAMHAFSVSRMVSSLFPEHQWDASLFVKRGQGHWTSIGNQKRALDEIGVSLGIQEDDLEGWYKVTVEDFAKHNAWGLISLYNGSPLMLLSSLYPDHDWKPWKFASNKSRHKHPPIQLDSEEIFE